MNFEQLSLLRPDLAFIAHLVEKNTRVLDLGCGNGIMMDYLQSEKQCNGYGIEIDDAMISLCVERGVSVIQRDLEAGLSIFGDYTFNTVLCLSVLQMIKDVEGMLRDIARVGQEAIISFPNFAYWPHRIALLRGRMSVSKSLPYEWYDTPNLRCATICDFEELADEVGLRVLECISLDNCKPIYFLPNWRGSLAVFRLRKK